MNTCLMEESTGTRSCETSKQAASKQAPACYVTARPPSLEMTARAGRPMCWSSLLAQTSPLKTTPTATSGNAREAIKPGAHVVKCFSVCSLALLTYQTLIRPQGDVPLADRSQRIPAFPRSQPLQLAVRDCPLHQMPKFGLSYGRQSCRGWLRGRFRRSPSSKGSFTSCLATCAWLRHRPHRPDSPPR